MKHHIKTLVESAIQQLKSNGILPHELDVAVYIEYARNPEHGDYACNIAMTLSKQLKQAPREIAQQLQNVFPVSELIEKIEIAGPGFINFKLSQKAHRQLLEEILEKKSAYGRVDLGKGKRINMEIVSANPTGPLHVGHGRGAAFGASLANLLEVAGFDVCREYYVNDAGRQMHILATSVWLRYLELFGAEFLFPSNGYQGEYVIDLAQALKQLHGDQFCQPIEEIFKDLPPDEAPDQSGDKEAHIDALILKAQTLLKKNYDIIFQYGLQQILEGIKEDLTHFGLTYQSWFSESELHEKGLVHQAVEQLKKSAHVYERDGALWFRSTDFNDDKDRVLIRENGQPTYFAADVANHWYKYERGFQHIINIFGSDHHGYIARLTASVQAMGFDPATLEFQIVQFAILYRGKERVQMSTRKGSFVTLKELCDEVGTDAARFFYVMRKPEQHMDFDLALAKSQSNDNPVYYIQYAYARISSVFRQLAERGGHWDVAAGLAAHERLVDPHEKGLLLQLFRYAETIEMAAEQHEPHLLAHYLRELAEYFHSYYNACPFLTDDVALMQARLTLIAAARQVFLNGLQIIGVSIPETM